MPKPRDELSALFRSLGPGDSSTQASPSSPLHGAEQRWPLLKAMAPSRPASTPPLTDDEKIQRTRQDASSVTEKKRSLTVPGLGDKLAKSLGKMSGSAMANPKRALEKAVSRESEASPVFLREPVRAQTVAPQPQYPKPLAEPAIQVGDTQGKAGRRSLFAKTTPQTVPGHLTEEEGAGSDVDSLSNIFERLATANAPAIPVPGKKSSFLRRLGRK